MSTWSLSQLLAGLHDDIEQRLATARKTFGHSTTKGKLAFSEQSENVRISGDSSHDGVDRF